MAILLSFSDESVHKILADPPFNLDKHYGDHIVDDLPELEYLSRCRPWISEDVRLLAPGGAFCPNSPACSPYIPSMWI